ncbi:MAG: M14 metallopeptidase family protein [Planctomycetota bacterium]
MIWNRGLPLVAATLCLVPSLAFSKDAPARLSYYLPQGLEYRDTVPKPSEVLGHEVGEWHARHASIVRYLEVLASKSDRVVVEEYARTHERRPLVLAAVSSPENLARLEEIRKRRHEAVFGGGGTASEVPDDEPVVVNLGYSVHGNESSGSNASVLTAYFLAAAKHEKIDELLERCIILIDPCLNPDGLDRFATWANMHRGRVLVADAKHREHVEPWPNGRTNHYWFDLNRDWLLLTQPESRGRIDQFHRWLPNVVGDFHEMGSDSTYFFQPGVPTRQNPWTPAKNLSLTREIAKFHARALDQLGVLYYTEESFDDFYYGKGSTYPDVHGAIGILFELASSRGHLRESEGGPLSFPFTIRNQFVTSLSTIQGAFDQRKELLEYQRQFYFESRTLAAKDSVEFYVASSPGDPMRLRAFVDVLLRHQIEVYALKTAFERGGVQFDTASSIVVPVSQAQYRLVKALFEKRVKFQDSTFYDVSTWNLPLSFGLPFDEISRDEQAEGIRGDRILEAGRGSRSQRVQSVEDAFAYIFEWRPYFAPRLLWKLLDRGIRARVASKPFNAELEDGPRRFDFGSIVVPVGPQDVSKDVLRKMMESLATENGVDVFGVGSGLTPGGVDLGSPSLIPLGPVKPLLLVGSSVSTYDAGSTWHVLDQRFGIRVSLAEVSKLGSLDLSRYTHVIMVGGASSAMKESGWEELERWVSRGGVVLGMKSSVSKLRSTLLKSSKSSAPKIAKDRSTERVRYAEYETERSLKLVSGAIFEVQIDSTHPIGYGFFENRVPVFRRGTTTIRLDSDPYANVARYAPEPLLSGFCSPENQKRIASTASVVAKRVGKGSVILYMDDLNFRGIWYGTSKFFLNGLFFGSTIRSTSSR